MSDYVETLKKHRRLAILEHLEGSAEYTSNATILQHVLDARGLTCSYDQVVTELTWLKDQGFVTLAHEKEFAVASATIAGAEIARGVSTHPEIQRPKPRR